ncbi:hypothetical protein [Yoonia sp. SS1-5]|uniref:Uncharacterized protein n=1 Tax=Yoonia rhodophyticola TaxID=3137370 RepID=A0AAN0MD46_9RHOB
MRFPLTLRLIFYSLRSLSLAVAITLIGWLALVPASGAERTALNAPLSGPDPLDLTAMRVARAMVHFAPDRAARMLSRSTDGEISVALAGMILRDLAAGNRSSGRTAAAVPPEDASAPTRSTGGAKFVRVDR